MRITLIVLLIYCFGNLFANDTITVIKNNSREYTINEAFNSDSVSAAKIMIPFEGFDREQIKIAYQLNRQTVDSIIQVDSLSANLFVRYGLQGIQICKDAKESPSKAMSLFTPILLIILLLVFIPLGIRAFIIGPGLTKAVKPVTDHLSESEEKS